MVVQEIMSEQPFAIEANHSVREALNRLLAQDIRHLPVLDRGMLVGMLSDRDVRSAAAEAYAGGSPDQLTLPVSQIMSSDPITVDPETDVTEVIDLMLEHKVGALPVVVQDKLVGIVSYVDVLRVARAELEDA